MAERSFNGRVLYEDGADNAFGEISASVGNWIEDDEYGVFFSRTNSVVSEAAKFTFLNGERGWIYVAGSNGAEDTNDRGGRISNIPLNQGSSGPNLITPLAANVALYGAPVTPGRTYTFSYEGYFENDIVSSGNGRSVNGSIRQWRNNGTLDLGISYANHGWVNTDKGIIKSYVYTFTAQEGVTHATFLIQALEKGSANLLSEAYVRNVRISEVIPARTAISTPRVAARFMGGSTQFNGTTSTIPTILTDNTAFTSGFVLHGWINPRSLGEGTSGRIFDKGTSTTGVDGFTLYQNSVPARLGMIVNNGAGVNSASGSINFNRWQHVIAHVSADATVSFYINNVLSGTPGTTAALSGITTSNPLTIGNRSTATDRTFDGSLAELGIISLAGRGDLTQDEITALYTQSARPTGSTNFWPLSEQPSTYTDIIGGATGTGASTTFDANTPTQARVATRDMGTALRFSGVENIVRATAMTHLVINNPATISCYFFVTEDGDGTIFANRLNTTDSNIHFGWRNASLRIEGAFFTSGTPNEYRGRFATPRLKKNQWYNLVVVFSGILNEGTDNTDLYVDGVLVPRVSTNFGGAGNDNIMSIGGQATVVSVVNDFAGMVDEFRTWNRALSAQEIADMYFKNIVPGNGLVREYLFNETSSTTAFDTSGNGNNGTITGATYTTDVPLYRRSPV